MNDIDKLLHGFRADVSDPPPGAAQRDARAAIGSEPRQTILPIGRLAVRIAGGLGAAGLAGVVAFLLVASPRSESTPPAVGERSDCLDIWNSEANAGNQAVVSALPDDWEVQAGQASIDHPAAPLTGEGCAYMFFSATEWMSTGGWWHSNGPFHWQPSAMTPQPRTHEQAPFEPNSAITPDGRLAAPETATPTKARLRPLIENEIARYSWPTRYTLTRDSVWRKLSPQVANVTVDSRAVWRTVGIWNLCGWTNAGVDLLDGSGDETTESVTRGLTDHAAKDFEIEGTSAVVQRLVTAMTTGDSSALKQFSSANDCSRFPR